MELTIQKSGRKLLALVIAKDLTAIRSFIEFADQVEFWKRYMDAYYPNQGFGKVIHEACQCNNCGGLSTVLQPSPLCGGCGFSLALEKIEFGRAE